MTLKLDQRISVDPATGLEFASRVCVSNHRCLRLLFFGWTILMGCQGGETGSRTEKATSGEPLVVPNADARYLGSNACRECHKELFESYQTHPMAHSMMSISQSTTIEDHSSEFESGGTTYRIETSNGRTWHHEIRKSPNGKTIYDRRVPIDFSVGSGARGRSFLTNLNGRLFQSPITWYADGEKWDLSPGFAPGSHPGFDRRVNHACLSCHAGTSNVHKTDPDCFGSPPFAEAPIGCERCHGPASEHVDFHRNPVDLRSTSDPIVNPDHLNPSLQDAICNQCHLQGQRRVLREARTEFDFRPGMRLGDVWTTILKTKGVRSGVANAVSQVEQMHASVCFQRSDGAMTCTSCHDPHRSPDASQKQSFYKASCLKCHSSGVTICSEQLSERERKNDSCIDCHMPRFGAADVHSSQTDHRILRKPTPGSPEEPRSPQTADDLQFFHEPTITPNKSVEERAAAIFFAETAYANKSDAAARYAVRILTPDRLAEATDVEGLIALGQAYLQLNRTEDAWNALLRVTEISPENEGAFELLATSSHESNRLLKAKQYYEKLISLNPARPRYHGRYAHVLGELGDIQGAIKAGERALELDPALSQTHEWLVRMYRLAGDTANSKRHQQQFEMFRDSLKNSKDPN